MREEYDPPEKKIEKFWKESFYKASEEKLLLKDLTLPLARIKRLMKVEEGVRMVASEVPILFSKIAEKFIEELTFRAWINTEENKRRILQRGDISVAVKTSEMYDFLIYIVPNNDISHAFDRMISNKLIVEGKISNERRSFSGSDHDRFATTSPRGSDIKHEVGLPMDFMAERPKNINFASEGLNSLDFNAAMPLDLRNLSPDYTNNQGPDFYNLSRSSTSSSEKPFKDL